MVTALLFGSMIVFLAIGVPISFTLGAAVMATIFLAPDFTVSPGIIPQRIFGGLESTSIMAIAFFVLAGNIMTKGGISSCIVEFCNSIIGNIRGGMSLVLVLACAFFAALSGSAPATVVAIGVMLYADMVKLGYPKERVAGLLVVSGGMGPIIPPSIIMIVYGTITGASISKMFKAGLGIGIIIMVILMAVCLFYAHKEQWPKNAKRISLKEISSSFVHAIPAILLPVIILGGIYSGLMTPTESAAVAVVWALVVSLFVYKEMKVRFCKRIGHDFVYYCYVDRFFMDFCLLRYFRRYGCFYQRLKFKSYFILHINCITATCIWYFFGRYCYLRFVSTNPLAISSCIRCQYHSFWDDCLYCKCCRYNDSACCS